jgi:branched-chain amino acid transport system permease protein
VLYLVLGLVSGATYAVVAIGFVLIFTVLRIYPFYHGAMVVFCSYAFLWVYQHNHQEGVAVIACLAVGIFTSLAIGASIVRPLRRYHFAALIAGIGLAQVFVAYAGEHFYHGLDVSYPQAVKLAGGVQLLGFTIDYNSLMVFVFAIVTMIGFDIFFRRLRPGIEMRAISDDEAGAALSGVRSGRSINIAFIAAGVAAAAAGILIGIQQSTISPQLADPLTIKGLAAVVLAGSGSLRGAVLASLLIGVAESLAQGYLSSNWAEVVAYAFIIAALLARPAGLMGEASPVRA